VQSLLAEALDFDALHFRVSLYGSTIENCPAFSTRDGHITLAAICRECSSKAVVEVNVSPLAPV